MRSWRRSRPPGSSTPPGGLRPARRVGEDERVLASACPHVVVAVRVISDPGRPTGSFYEERVEAWILDDDLLAANCVNQRVWHQIAGPDACTVRHQRRLPRCFGEGTDRMQVDRPTKALEPAGEVARHVYERQRGPEPEREAVGELRRSAGLESRDRLLRRLPRRESPATKMHAGVRNLGKPPELLDRDLLPARCSVCGWIERRTDHCDCCCRRCAPWKLRGPDSDLEPALSQTDPGAQPDDAGADHDRVYGSGCHAAMLLGRLWTGFSASSKLPVTVLQ